jgi:membrane protein DedA with SNARE-associated domain
LLPEINPLAAGMAGAERISPGRYIAIVTVSALVWAATWTGAGYALGNVATGLSTPFGVVTGIIVLAAAIAAIAVALKHRRAARASVSTWP